MSFAQAAKLHMQRIEENVNMKRHTRNYWKEIEKALFTNWPELWGEEIRRITPAVCPEWGSRYAKLASPNRYNNTVSFLRHVFEVAIENGILYSNPGKDGGANDFL